MNRLQELLVILAEECAEVSQAASKCVRFGMDSKYQDVSNRARLEQELGDFMAMFKLILEESNLSDERIMECAEAKLIKVEQYMTNGKNSTPTMKRKPRKNKRKS